MVDQALSQIMENHSGTLECLFPDENALLVLDCDCLNLSVYHPYVPPACPDCGVRGTLLEVIGVIDGTPLMKVLQ